MAHKRVSPKASLPKFLPFMLMNDITLLVNRRVIICLADSLTHEPLNLLNRLNWTKNKYCFVHHIQYLSTMHYGHFQTTDCIIITRSSSDDKLARHDVRWSLGLQYVQCVIQTTKHGGATVRLPRMSLCSQSLGK